MRLVWLTDIHLDFLPNHRFDSFFSSIRAQKPDAVIISGDIGEGPTVAYYLKRLEKRLQCPIYFVLGNHDFYHSSIADVSKVIRDLSEQSALLTWLNTCTAPIQLAPGVALVGHDGWSDGRLGDFLHSDVMMEDYQKIAELRDLDPTVRLERLHALGDAAADHLRALLPAALADYEHIIVVTHPVPYREVCLYQGQVASPNNPYLPHFTCKAIGDLLLEVMTAHPHQRMTVLCGHTHGAGEAHLLPNLHVIVGGAEYGQPVVQQVFEL